MRVAVDPLDGLVDEVPALAVIEVGQGDEVTLVIETTDAAGHPWRSETVFRADEAGTVDVARDAPVRSAYPGVDASGPWWAMEFDDMETAPVAFAAPPDALTYRVTAVGGGSSATVALIRRWLRNARVERASGDGYVGLCFIPNAPERRPGVLVVPGSTGMHAIAPAAALLASRGYAAMVLGYLKEEGLPSSLLEIPVERVRDGIRTLAEHASVDESRIAVLAASVGSEGALTALADDSSRVRALVAIAPSSVVWQAIGNGPPRKTSSWSQNGAPLPYLTVHGERLLPELVKHAVVGRLRRGPRPRALHLLTAYGEAFQHDIAVEQASIPVERLQAPLLLISGEDDQMWPSTEMARRILERRQLHGVPPGDQHLSFAQAGHFIRPPIIPTTVAWNEELVSGGTAAGTALAQRAAWDATLTFLDQHLVP